MKLDDNYTVTKDTYGWTMTFSEERERTKANSSKEKYVFEDHTYHATMKQCLKAYLDKSLAGKDSAQEILDEILRVENVIADLELK